MKISKKVLSFTLTVALVACLNWSYLGNLWSLISSAALGMVSGNTVSTTALQSELENLTLSKLLRFDIGDFNIEDFDVKDFLADILNGIINDDDTSDDNSTTDDVAVEDTTEESDTADGESGKYTVSQTKIEHVLKNHTFGRLKKTIDVLMEKGLTETAENLLNEKSFFNPEWTEEKVTEVVNYAYNEAVLKGITNENYTTIVSGEKITVCFQDGQFRTAYGEYTFSLSDFGY